MPPDPPGSNPLTGVATKWDLQLFIYDSAGLLKTCHHGGRVTPGVPEVISKSCHAPGGNGFIRFTLE